MRTRDAWLRRIIEKSSTWEERLGPDFDDARRPTTRLAWDGLDEATVRRALADVRLRAGAPLPPWAETLQACLHRLDTPSTAPERVHEEGRRYLDSARPIPFEEALVPFVDHASESLLKDAEGYPVLSAAARALAERALLRELSRLCARTLAQEFSFHRMCQAPGTVLAIARGEETRDRGLYTSFLQELRAGGLEGSSRASGAGAAARRGPEPVGNTIEECLHRLARELPVLRETLANGDELRHHHRPGRGASTLTAEDVGSSASTSPAGAASSTSPGAWDWKRPGSRWSSGATGRASLRASERRRCSTG